MPRRALIRLVRLLAVASACLVPAGVAHAATPGNDLPTSATLVTPQWTSLSVTQDIVVQAADWGDATTGPEDADPLPSCTGAVGFRSMWYSVSVPEAAVLRVTVISTDTARYQPVVTILDTNNNDEVSCGVAALGKPGAAASATAYVTPLNGAAHVYLVRVAQVGNNTPSAGLPTLTVRFAGRDVTAPHIVVSTPGTVQPKTTAVYDAIATSDLASGIDPASATWEFHEKIDGRDVLKTRAGMRVTYRWQTTGPHVVRFDVKDLAGNDSMYTFTTLVRDTVRPSVSFSLVPPEPGARTLHILVKASESVRLRLLVTQAGRARPLLRKDLMFWGATKHPRAVRLNRPVRTGVIVTGGIARDLAGNATALPQCVVDPVTGRGSCPTP